VRAPAARPQTEQTISLAPMQRSAAGGVDVKVLAAWPRTEHTMSVATSERSAAGEGS
jgi:hypothetical protein